MEYPLSEGSELYRTNNRHTVILFLVKTEKLENLGYRNIFISIRSHAQKKKKICRLYLLYSISLDVIRVVVLNVYLQ